MGLPMHSAGCHCCNCAGLGETQICGTVTPGCGPKDGFVVTATGPATLTTTTDSSGNYCFNVVKKGNYTITLTAPCGPIVHDTTVSIPSCGTLVNHVDFTVTYPTLRIDANDTCGNHVDFARWTVQGPCLAGGPCPSFGGAFPFTFTMLPGADYQIDLCSNDNCYVAQTVHHTAGCSSESLNLTLDGRLYSYSFFLSSCSSHVDGGTLVSGLDDATITVSGPAAGGASVVNDGDGWYTITDLKALCDFQIHASRPRFVDTTFPNLGSPNFTMPCGDVTQDLAVQLSMPIAPGFQCFPMCCKYPLNDPLTITDSEGEHNVMFNGFGFQTDCILKTGVPVTCQKPPNNSCDGGTFTGSIAYFYTVGCVSGVWKVSRNMAFCVFADGSKAPVNSTCVDGSPQSGGNDASCAVFEYSALTLVGGEESDHTSPLDTCGPLTAIFGFSFGFADAATLKG